jgi:hypothetical protein
MSGVDVSGIAKSIFEPISRGVAIMTIGSSFVMQTSDLQDSDAVDVLDSDGNPTFDTGLTP